MEKVKGQEKTILIKESPTLQHQDDSGNIIPEIREKMNFKDVMMLSKLTGELHLPSSAKRDPKHLMILDIQKDFSIKKLIVGNWGSRVHDLTDGRIYHIALFPKEPGVMDNRHYKFWFDHWVFSPALKNVKNFFMEQFWVPTEIFWWGSKNPLVIEETFHHDAITDTEYTRQYDDGVKAEVEEERMATRSKDYISYIVYAFLAMIGIVILMTLMS